MKRSIVLTVAIGLILAVLSLGHLASAQATGVTPRQASAQALSIKAAYVTDTAQSVKTSFGSGDPIYYHIDANNANSSAISISINFFADTIIKSNDGSLHQYIIIDKTYKVNMPPGPSRFYTPSAVPYGVTSGQYHLGALIYENANRNDNASLESGPFNVTRVLANPLNVPYISQFNDSANPNFNNECGETSVAMAAKYYADLYDTNSDWITAVRNTMGVGPNDETNAQQLTDALYKLDEKQITVTTIPNTTPVGQAVQRIEAATTAGYPVIAFVNAQKLGRSYTGHWFVITGISGNTVTVNDPDNSKTGTGTNKPGPTTLSLSAYEAAAYSGAVGEGQPYGLIVTGEDFTAPA